MLKLNSKKVRCSWEAILKAKNGRESFSLENGAASLVYSYFINPYIPNTVGRT